MKNKPDEKKSAKGFFAKLFDKLDKKMEEKSRFGYSCKNDDNEGKNSCCS
jgi:hypothetical protein